MKKDTVVTLQLKSLSLTSGKWTTQ